MTGSTQGLNSCSACGIAFPIGARFCPGCGSPLESTGPRPATLPASAVADPLIGQVIADRYRIVSMLGRGGMGVVYRIEHVHIGKLMAMKLLSGELAGDPTTLARFEREAKAVSQLSHPNTVQIFDFGESANLAYLVMEYLPGRDLATLIAEEGALPFPRVAKIGAQIAGSVEEAHTRGIIHRDIKPENVMVLDTSEQSDFVKVLDFGIAKLRNVESATMVTLATQKGHVIGTPFYMAPEQIRAEAIDHRVDVYALGGLMYTALTGTAPFEGDTAMEVLSRHLNEPLVLPSQRAPGRRIPAEADRIIAKALAKNAADRHASMEELREELEHYLASVGADDARPVPRLKLAGNALATRGDVDRYERGIRRTLRVGGIVAAIALVGVGWAAYALWPDAGAAVRDAEAEPNDEPAQANALVSNAPIKAFLGKRRSTTESDADVYRFAIVGPPQVADIAVSALPNVDLVVELVERGNAQPRLVVNSGAIGEPERIPNLQLAADTYFVRVRQPIVAGVYPIENVSDAYTIALSLTPPVAGHEHEINDSFEVAEPLVPGTPVQGLLGWAKDRDVYCAAPDGQARVVSVSGVPGIDLVLQYLDRNTNAGQRIDRGGIGEGERIELPKSQARKACFTISAREREGANKVEPVQRYEISLR